MRQNKDNNKVTKINVRRGDGLARLKMTAMATTSTNSKAIYRGQHECINQTDAREHKHTHYRRRYTRRCRLRHRF